MIKVYFLDNIGSLVKFSMVIAGIVAILLGLLVWSIFNTKNGVKRKGVWIYPIAIVLFLFILFFAVIINLF